MDGPSPHSITEVVPIGEVTMALLDHVAGAGLLLALLAAPLACGSDDDGSAMDAGAGGTSIPATGSGDASSRPSSGRGGSNVVNSGATGVGGIEAGIGGSSSSFGDAATADSNVADRSTVDSGVDSGPALSSGAGGHAGAGIADGGANRGSGGRNAGSGGRGVDGGAGVLEGGGAVPTSCVSGGACTIDLGQLFRGQGSLQCEGANGTCVCAPASGSSISGSLEDVLSGDASKLDGTWSCGTSGQGLGLGLGAGGSRI